MSLSGTQLSADAQRLLQAIFDRFHERGEWPQYWTLTRTLRDMRVRSVAESLSLDYINVPAASDADQDLGEHGQRAVLSVLAIRCCDGSDEDLADFVLALQLCQALWDESGDNPRLTSDHLKRRHHLSDLRACKVFLLLEREAGFTSGGWISPDRTSWYRDVTPVIHRYRDVGTVDEYLARKLELPSLSTEFSPSASVELQSIFASLHDLQRQQSAPSPVDERDFAFIDNPGLRAVLARDFTEAQCAFAVGAHKAAALLAAGTVEGMLLAALQKPSVTRQPQYPAAVARFPRVGADVDWGRVSLTLLVAAAVQLQLLDATAERLASGARDMRDTIHPNAEVRQGTRAEREEAEVLLAAAKLLYRQLSLVG